MRTFEQTKPPRLLAINDLSGHSHTSLMAIIPIMQSLGIGVTALPTAMLSSNTELDGFELIDLTGRLDGFLQQWKQHNLSFNAIYSGFLSSEQQTELVLKAIWMFSDRKPLVVVDPVMADDGMLYPCFGQEIVRSMQNLVVRADLITPNLTEAALLLNEKYNPSISDQQVRNYCLMLSDTGPGMVAITNVRSQHFPGKTSVIAFDKTSGKYHTAACDYQPVNYPGTGDIFTSVLTALLMKGSSFFDAVDKSVSFVSRAIEITRQTGTPDSEGVCLELALPSLTGIM